MNVFDAWLIIVGLAIGAGLAWLVMLDLRRRDDDIAARESRAEAAWIADTLQSREIAADAEAVEAVLHLHRAYLAGIPDDGSLRATHPTAELDRDDEDEEDEEDDGEDELDRRFAAGTRTPAAPSALPERQATGAASAGAPTAASYAAPSMASGSASGDDAASGDVSASGGDAVSADEAEATGEALEPAWRDEDMAAAHDALDALLKKPPRDD